MTVKKRKTMRRKKVRKSTKKKSRSKDRSTEQLLKLLGIAVGGVALASILSSKKVPSREIKPGLYELNYKPSYRILRAIEETEQTVAGYE